MAAESGTICEVGFGSEAKVSVILRIENLLINGSLREGRWIGISALPFFHGTAA